VGNDTKVLVSVPSVARNTRIAEPPFTTDTRPRFASKPRAEETILVNDDSAAAAERPPLSFATSARLTQENARWVAGGVNSNFRMGMQPGPLVFERGEGP
jgi:hypothetical protein